MNTTFQQRCWPGLAAGLRRSRLPAILLACLLTAISSAILAQTDEVLSCGYNADGEIGDSTTTNRSLLTPANTISGIKTIVCGAYHTLALDSAGTVWAWGSNSNGQLGTGDTINRTTPVAILHGMKAIAAGNYFSMALGPSGLVYTWGSNSNGQLGQGDTTDRWSPTLVSSISRISTIACGGYHSVFLSEDGNIYVCGWNYYGQLGTGDTTDIDTPFNNFLVWEPTSNIKAVACGAAHTLIQYYDNHVASAGYNGDGELGIGNTTNQIYFYNTGFYARSIAAGGFHSLAVGLDGTAWAWGYNAYGQLGTHDYTYRSVPTQMPGAINVKTVAGGGYHTLVLEADGKVLATGYNGQGQLGNNTTTTRNQLAAVSNASLIGVIAAGSYDSVLLKPFTKSLATGYNNYGQLGIGSTVSQKNSPVPMKSSSILAVSAGPSGWHSLLLKADGTVWACGDNDFGQLGNGTTTSSFTPIQVKGVGGVGQLSNIIAIAAGNFHSMALAANGTVYTWGRNSHGQLGTGDLTDRYYPTQVPGVAYVTAIAAGGWHSLLLGQYGAMAGCGYNGYGQLGSGDTIDRSSFTVPTGSGWIHSLAGGDYHSLILTNGYEGEFFQGQIMSSGLNDFGQLGSGDTTSEDSFTFDNGTLAGMMSAGDSHSLHLNAYGEVYGTGYNGDGELGLGDTSNRTGWIYIFQVDTIGIACGFAHSLFQDVYGNLYASGEGVNGQLGNGSTGNQLYPTYVPGAPYTTSMAGGWGHTLIVTAPPIEVASVKVSPSSMVGGSSATGTVTLTGLAGAGGQTVTLSSDNSAAKVPASVKVTSTSKTATFKITTTHVSAKTVAHIYATLNNSVYATLTINP